MLVIGEWSIEANSVMCMAEAKDSRSGFSARYVHTPVELLLDATPNLNVNNGVTL